MVKKMKAEFHLFKNLHFMTLKNNLPFSLIEKWRKK